MLTKAFQDNDSIFMKANRSPEKEMKTMSIDRFHYGEGWLNTVVWKSPLDKRLKLIKGHFLLFPIGGMFGFVLMTIFI